MPRIARVVAAGYPHHITQRGNYRQKIFADDTDQRKYLSLLKEESKRYHLIILRKNQKNGRSLLRHLIIPMK